MATHSSTFAWKIPWAEKPGRPQSTGVAKSTDSSSKLSLSTYITVSLFYMYQLIISMRQNLNL